ncbi:MAG: LPP20 family lipoprotein [Nitrospinae bacterium]|nr:LPP20 family lipoprotein [Nitrospinota bacterium]
MKRTLLTVGMILAAMGLFSMLAPVAAADNYRCDYIPPRDRPAWVDKGFYEPGLYAGVGQAARKGSIEEQVEAAKASAYRDLSQKISVQIKSTLKDQMKSSSKSFMGSFEQNVELITETSIKETLQGLQVREKWLDQRNCVLWVLATVEVESVERVKKGELNKSKYGLLQTSYEKLVKDANLPLLSSLVQLNDLNVLMGEIDFAYISSSAQTKQNWREKLQNEINVRTALRERNRDSVMLYVKLNDGVTHSEKQVNLVVSHIQKGLGKSVPFFDGCDESQNCLARARENGFRKMAYLEWHQRIGRDAYGTPHGTLALDYVLYDVQSGAMVGKPQHAESKIVSWEAETLEWDVAAKKIVQDRMLVVGNN